MVESLNLKNLNEALKDHVSYNNVLFRVVLVKDPKDTHVWLFYYAQFILTKDKLSVESRILFENEDVVIAEINSNRDNLMILTQKIKDKETHYYIPNLNPDIFTKSKLSRLNIYSKFTDYNSRDLVSSYQTKEMGIDFPCEEVRLTPTEKGYADIKLARYRSFSELIREILGINLDKFNALPYTISYLFKIEEGKIERAQIKKDLLTVKLNYDEQEKDNYVVKFFIDNNKNNEDITREFDVKGTISYKLDFKPDKIEVRLIYKDKVIDKAFCRPKKISSEKVTEFNEELLALKEQVISLKDKLKISKELEVGSSAEKKLNDAEKKKAPEDVIQALGEALEAVCRNYRALFGIESKKIGLELHRKVVWHWKHQTGRPWTDLRYQTGTRQVIRINNLKKHEDYEPYSAEARYLILLAWRGYYEILRMIKEVQDST